MVDFASGTSVPDGAKALALFLTRLLDENAAAFDPDPERTLRDIRMVLAQWNNSQDSHDAGQAAAVKGGLAPWQIQRVKGYIAANIGERLDLGVLAELVRLSAGHFARAFKSSMGLSPHAYVTTVRIEASMRMIQRGDLSLAQIAVACGLSDQAHLCHVFRRNLGLSPAVWRRRQQCDPVRHPQSASPVRTGTATVHGRSGHECMALAC